MKRWLILSSLLAFGFAFSPLAQAQDIGVVVKERVGIMKNVSGTLKALGKSAKAGKVGAKDAARAAKALAGAKKATALFPAGSSSDKVKSRAKPEIWAEWPKFEAGMGKLVAGLEGVQKAAASGDAGALNAAVKTAHATCGGCHKPFRGPKPK